MTRDRLPHDALARLEKVEALIRRPGTAGERAAAVEARNRIYRAHGLDPAASDTDAYAAFSEADLSELEAAVRRARQGDFSHVRAATEHLRRASAAAEARRAAAESVRRAQEDIERRTAAARAEREAAERATRRNREAAEAKAAKDAAFLKRASNRHIISIIRFNPLGASSQEIAETLDLKMWTVRAAISRMRAAGAPIEFAAGRYRWKTR